MTSSFPKSPKRESARGAEDDIDEVIEKIDAALPLIHERAKSSRAGRVDSPTKAFSIEQIKKTRQAFTDMHEDPILTKSGEDIKLNGTTRVSKTSRPTPASSAKPGVSEVTDAVEPAESTEEDRRNLLLPSLRRRRRRA